MSWQGEMSTIVRYIIDDTDSDDYTFTDTRIETTILVAAHMVGSIADFTNDYEINIESCFLSPDPTEADTKDDSFVSLVSLKAACIILGGQVRSESGNAISIKDGPSAIDLKGVTDTLSRLYKDMCEKYDDLLLQYKAGRSIAGKAILTPYSPGSDYSRPTGDHRSGGFLNF